MPLYAEFPANFQEAKWPYLGCPTGLDGQSGQASTCIGGCQLTTTGNNTTMLENFRDQ